MHDLGPEVLDRARISRDPRFDGRFFIAVLSTGVYCRPICPTPSPRPENVRYYPSAAAAADAGFRPCLRCRPEAAPASPAWLGVTAVVRRGLRLIEEGALDGQGVEALAERLGIGARHLRRLFVRHVGASPVAVAQTRRLHFAKRLLDDTDLPVMQVALESGYGSLRRFNAAVRDAWGQSPRELRRQRGTRKHGGIRLRLSYRPPYDWQAMLDFLAARAVPEIEWVHGGRYSRTIVQDGEPASITLEPAGRGNALTLEVQGAPAGSLLSVVSRARRCFDLEMDPACVENSLGSDPLLAELVRRSPGIRIPGVWGALECAVRAILSQGSPEAEQRLLSRLVRSCGSRTTAFRTPEGGLTHLFPTAQALAVAQLDGIGLAASQVAAIREVAEAFLERRLDFRRPSAKLVAEFRALPGISESAAEYVLLRALGDPDAFPLAGSDLRPWPEHMRRAGGGAPLAELAEAWRPWRGYAAAYLWRESARNADRSIPRTPPQPVRGCPYRPPPGEFMNATDRKAEP